MARGHASRPSSEYRRSIPDPPEPAAARAARANPAPRIPHPTRPSTAPAPSPATAASSRDAERATVFSCNVRLDARAFGLAAGFLLQDERPQPRAEGIRVEAAFDAAVGD